MKFKLRLIWRRGEVDHNGVFMANEYKTDVIELPDEAQAFRFSGDKNGFLPELVGAEWIKEEEK